MSLTSAAIYELDMCDYPPLAYGQVVYGDVGPNENIKAFDTISHELMMLLLTVKTEGNNFRIIFG